MRTSHFFKGNNKKNATVAESPKILCYGESLMIDKRIIVFLCTIAIMQIILFFFGLYLYDKCDIYTQYACSH